MEEIKITKGKHGGARANSGRPPEPNGLYHGKNLSCVRVTVEQLQNYRDKATAAGMSLSEWVRKRLGK